VGDSAKLTGMETGAAQADRTDSAAAPVLEARELVKRYGERAALRGVSLSAERGELLAVIGPNGAGKTTLLSILAGVQQPDGGRLARAPRDIGWVPQQAALYGKLTVRENLDLFARLERCRDPAGATTRMLELTELVERAGDQVATLSTGNRQRVNIAVGLLSEPELLLLDEPSAGLDSRQRERLWDFILRLAGGGTTVLYATHNIQEADRYAARVAVLADGELVFTGPPADLEAAAGDAAASTGAADDLEAAFVALLRQRGH
jgi:ABC-2 type transport system ATP-binding protein